MTLREGLEEWEKHQREQGAICNAELLRWARESITAPAPLPLTDRHVDEHGDDWAMQIAKNIRVKWMQSALLAGGEFALPKGHLTDIADALRAAEATGHVLGHINAEK
ncbi:hypothetical protein ACYQOP_26510 [Methylobacterium sp. CM6247]